MSEPDVVELWAGRIHQEGKSAALEIADSAGVEAALDAMEFLRAKHEAEMARWRAEAQQLREVLHVQRRREGASGVGPYARALCLVIEQISEERWASGWYSGIEYHLWGAVELARQGKPNIYGDEVVELLDVLAADAGGWWRSPTTDSSTYVGFVPMDDWLADFRVWATPEHMAWLEGVT